MMENAYLLGQENSILYRLQTAGDTLKEMKDGLVGGLERLLHRQKKEEAYVMSQEDMPVNLSEAREVEFEEVDSKPLKKGFLSSISRHGKNFLRKMADRNFLANTAISVYYGSMAGYYHAYNHTGAGVMGLVGMMPHFLEAGKMGEDSRRVNNFFYYAGAAGFVLGGINKLMIAQGDASVNEDMFFYPAMVDFGLALYNLLGKAQIHKKR
ncbi:hypothetical protein KY345_05480 [Candidatus Woesearchaeota archaeon]|nr:hypothetical protein [Candidatus Woesearchaeota archaeon]